MCYQAAAAHLQPNVFITVFPVASWSVFQLKNSWVLLAFGQKMEYVF